MFRATGSSRSGPASYRRVNDPWCDIFTGLGSPSTVTVVPAGARGILMAVLITNVDRSVHEVGGGWAATAQLSNVGLVSPWAAMTAPPKRIPSTQTSRKSIRVMSELRQPAEAAPTGRSTEVHASDATSQGRQRRKGDRDVVMAAPAWGRDYRASWSLA